jgi:tetratricopeptide (TPR) repeat protein
MAGIALSLAIPVFGQNAFSQGEALFMQNKPAEALAFLESSLIEDPANIQGALYLGIAYQQLERLDDAIGVYLTILPRGGSETPRIAFNLGNAYYSKGDAVTAEQYYTQALTWDPSFGSAWLNRANTRISAGSLREAVSDYQQFLVLEPRSAKRPQIERLINFINQEFAAEERKQLQAEAQAAAEAERRRRLLEEVSASLQSAADDSRGLSAGAEDVLGYEGEFEFE